MLLLPVVSRDVGTRRIGHRRNADGMDGRRVLEMVKLVNENGCNDDDELEYVRDLATCFDDRDDVHDVSYKGKDRETDEQESVWIRSRFFFLHQMMTIVLQDGDDDDVHVHGDDFPDDDDVYLRDDEIHSGCMSKILAMVRLRVVCEIRRAHEDDDVHVHDGASMGFFFFDNFSFRNDSFWKYFHLFYLNS